MSLEHKCQCVLKEQNQGTKSRFETVRCPLGTLAIFFILIAIVTNAASTAADTVLGAYLPKATALGSAPLSTGGVLCIT